MSEKNSFSNMNFPEKLLTITAITLLIVFSISLVLGMYFFGMAGFFHVFGIEYSSIFSLIGFIVCYFFLSLFLDVFSITFFKIASLYVKGKYHLFIIRMVLDCTFSWLALHTVDEFMTSISIPLSTEIIAVLLFFFIEFAFDDKRKD